MTSSGFKVLGKKNKYKKKDEEFQRVEKESPEVKEEREKERKRESVCVRGQCHND